MQHGVIKNLKAMVRDHGGGTMTMTAVMFPMILGFAGLGIDVSSWYMERRSTQTIVDSAAVEGAHHKVNYTVTEMQDLVTQFAATKGYNPASDTLAVNNPPVSGTYTGDIRFVEVISRRQATLYFLSAFYGIFNGENFTVTVESRGVAGALVLGDACVVALSPNSNKALNFSGTADVTSDCGMASNSTSASAIQVGGTASVQVTSATTVGNYRQIGGGTLLDEFGNPLVPQTLASAVEDPYAGEIVDPTPANPCTYSNGTNPVNTTVGTLISTGPNSPYYEVGPGTYCSGLKVQSNTHFLPGLYVINNGDFDANAGAKMWGTDVTFALIGDNDNKVGGIMLNGNAGVDFSATLANSVWASTEEQKKWTGILFYQALSAPCKPAQEVKFNGGADMSFDGVIYIPYCSVTMNGGASASPSCLKIYGYTVEFSGNSNVGNDETVCESIGLTGTSSSNLTRVQLVE